MAKHRANQAATLVNISEIRTRNNDLWMEILRIALESNPAATKKLLNGIRKNDKKVVKKFTELTRD